MNPILTKSKYLLGLECPRHLWITFNQPEKIRKVTLAEEFKFSQGDKVGKLAKTLFSGGIDLPVENYSENLQQTKEAMKKGKPLFEAGFAFENCFSRADILVPVRNEVSGGSKNSKNFSEPVGKEWDIIEVKSGTEVKDINVHDVSFQKYVYESNGLKIRKCFLMHLNKEYFEKGIMHIKDIPQHVKLNGKQNIQRECEMKKKVYVDKEGIKQFLATLKYPVYYLDFETFSTAIPMFDGLKSYSQVPFQFSLHIAKKEDSKPEHHAFMYGGNGDPREDFTNALKKVIGENGTVLVYNQSFEIGRLKELAEHFPEHKEWIENVLKRIVDLLVPFREFSYYNPKQQGSASIKDVLPAITGKSYKGMEIGDGGTASAEFYNRCYNNGKDVREALLKYCELDTLAEVMIVEKLREIVE